MAPEQWNGAPSSPATDVYAATAVFYECLTGKPPFSGKLGQLRTQHETAPVPLDAGRRAAAQPASRAAWPRTRRTGRRARSRSSPSSRRRPPRPTGRTGRSGAAATSRNAPLPCCRCCCSRRHAGLFRHLGRAHLARRRRAASRQARRQPSRRSARAAVHRGGRGGHRGRGDRGRDCGRTTAPSLKQLIAGGGDHADVHGAGRRDAAGAVGTVHHAESRSPSAATITATAPGDRLLPVGVLVGQAGAGAEPSTFAARRGHAGRPARRSSTKTAGTGWGEIQMISPAGKTSNQASYKLLCSERRAGFAAAASVQPPTLNAATCGDDTADIHRHRLDHQPEGGDGHATTGRCPTG